MWSALSVEGGSINSSRHYASRIAARCPGTPPATATRSRSHSESISASATVFPIAEQSADSGAMMLPGTGRHASHAELLDYLTDSAWFDFLGLIGKPAMCPVRQQQLLSKA